MSCGDLWNVSNLKCRIRRGRPAELFSNYRARLDCGQAPFEERWGGGGGGGYLAAFFRVLGKVSDVVFHKSDMLLLVLHIFH